MADAYREWVAKEAAKIGSDGCTVVSDWDLPCCWEHDLGYHYKKDPRSAYVLGWSGAAQISRAEVDARFRDCMRSMSGWYNPRPWIRWIGVRVGGAFLW